jgi:hypothetical protein
MHIISYGHVGLPKYLRLFLKNEKGWNEVSYGLSLHWENTENTIEWETIF